MSYGDMRRYADSLGANVCSDHLPGRMQGLYSAAFDMIVIDRDMDYTAKRCTLAHELVHRRHGDQMCDSTIGARVEHRTRRETAVLLIEPTRYALAERIYEGDIFLIAAELNVTKQIVEDYQKYELRK
jgi:Zn-dependent peptidase ImmA (M78 family)